MSRTAVSRTAVMRVPEAVHLEAKHVAQLRGQQPGDVVAEAWRRYMDENREQFASDMEEAARLLRNGCVEDLAAFTSRNSRARAEAAVTALRHS